MFYVGMDLSGPGNSKDTAISVFRERKSGLVVLEEIVRGASDIEIYELVLKLTRNMPVVAGLDAPLSYNDGGGDRPSDAALRRKIISAGMGSGSIMPPTLTRMAYLTLRGISVARMLLSGFSGKIKVVEVHPGSTMVLGGAPVELVKGFKRDMICRMELLSWLENKGLSGLGMEKDPSDHDVAACACVLGAWKWHHNKSSWIYPAELPLHPFDFAC